MGVAEMKVLVIGRRRMAQLVRTIRHAIAFVVVASGLSGVASATGTQWTASLQISYIEVVGTAGGFVVYLTGFSDSNCSSNSTGIYFYPDSEGVTQAGVDQILAASLAARATGTPVTILYDDSGNVAAGRCYCEYLTY